MFLKGFWDTASCTSREILFFHETLHIYGKVHVNHPAIMQPFMLEDSEYLKDREKFLVEAFKF
jgi:SET domain-containing protein